MRDDDRFSKVLIISMSLIGAWRLFNKFPYSSIYRLGPKEQKIYGPICWSDLHSRSLTHLCLRMLGDRDFVYKSLRFLDPIQISL